MKGCSYVSTIVGALTVGFLACGTKPAPPPAPPPVASSASASSAPPAPTHYGGVDPSPREIRIRIVEIMENDEGKDWDDAKVAEETDQCVDELHKVKADKPMKYKCYSNCVMTGGVFQVIDKCVDACDAKFGK